MTLSRMGLAHARLGLVLLALLVTSGCSGANPFRPTSRWAMDDPEYAAKYDRRYPSNDFEKSRRMVKQMVDARHIEGDSGIHLKSAYSSNPDAGMLELGGFGFPEEWYEVHGGVSLMFGEGNILGFPGIDLGARLQSPTRFTPFVGAGVYSDLTRVWLGALLAANDIDASISYRNHFAAVYPEAGFHYWLDGSTRMTLSAGYYFNSNGREHDFLMFGLTISGIGRQSKSAFAKPNSIEWSPVEESCADHEHLTFTSPPLVQVQKSERSDPLEEYLRRNFNHKPLPEFDWSERSGNAPNDESAPPPFPVREPSTPFE